MKESHQLEYYIKRLGLPQGCLSTIIDIYNQMDSRIWIIENSRSMNKRDSHRIKASSSYDRIEKTDGVSRWVELSQCIGFHTKMAERCWIPTKYWLVNEPEGNIPKRFNVAWGAREDFHKEAEQANRIMKELEYQLNAETIPLARQMRKIEAFLSREAPRLRERDEYIGIVVCTQGEPTDERGNTGPETLRRFMKSFTSLSDLPVKIIVRLCTDNDLIVDFYKTLDVNEKCDVLDDFWSEAIEVHLHNPWLTYGIGIHRLREACLGTDLMDNLDETPLCLDEIHEFCLEFFIGKNHDIPLSNPSRDFSGFLSDLRNILKREKLVWNPVKNKLCPWIDVDKIDTLFRKDAAAGRTGKRESYCRIPPPIAKYGGRNNLSCSVNSLKTVSQPKFQPQAPTRNSKELDDAIKRWSNPKGVSESARLERLLVDIPILFPRSNNAIEDHDYFDRWNEFSADAFEEGDEKTKKELVRRATRKAQRFFKDDQLPNDLTENQKTLFKSICSVLSKTVYKEENKKIDLNNFSKSNF